MDVVYLLKQGQWGAGDVRGGGGGLYPHPYDILLCFSMPRYFKKRETKKFLKSYNLR